MKNLSYIAPHPDTNGWRERHKKARWVEPIAHAIKAWVDYALEHEARFGSPIGEDGVLGPAWEQWGLALRTLLNGETGDLDCGTLDTILVDNLVEQGFGPL